MILLLTFCDFPWWVAWLLPFLLGLLLGWLLWARFKTLYEERQIELDALRRRVSEIESDLEDCKRSRIHDKGRIAELETKLSDAQKALAAREAEITGSSDAPESGAVAAGFVAGTEEDEDAGGDVNIYGALPESNLQIIEGVGPKMESVLKENGINSWSLLASKNADDLKAILAKYGDKYRGIIDPQTWPKQASLARDGEWETLISLQKELDAGRTGGSGQTDSKLEKIMVKLGLLRRYQQDDLKAIEGIGPKIEALLHEAGIDTWRTLSQTPVDRIQEILNAAGPRYKLAEPRTWPKQAELAAEGRFTELQIYQDELTGGR